MREEVNYKLCEKCGQLYPPLSIFLCKGKMVCESCFKTLTEDNTKFFNELEYPRGG